MRPYPILLLLFFPVYLMGQSLLPNGDFRKVNICCEYHVSCAPMGWWTSSGSTFNFEPYEYDKVTKQVLPHPALIKMQSIEGLNDRSYVQAPLLCPLVKGQEYILEFELGFRERKYAEIGVYFSDTFIHIPIRTGMVFDSTTGYFQSYLVDSLLPFAPTTTFDLNPHLLGPDKVQIRYVYTASGTERFILIGNFKSDTDTRYKRKLFHRSCPKYHLIELRSISLRPLETSSSFCNCEAQLELLNTLNRRHTFFGGCMDSLPVNMNTLFRGIPAWEPYFQREETRRQPGSLPHTGQAYRIENIYFDFDSAALRPESYPALDSLYEILEQFPGYGIAIIGHTDSLGGVAYNEDLSLRRAESVRSYLVNKGLDSQLIWAYGKGSSMPVAPNSTEEGRQQNRRVEFILRDPE